MASAGMSRRQASMALGREETFASRWARREAIQFRRWGGGRVHPALIDLAAARVQQTIDRLRAYQRMGADA
jgi:hypothetical protein